MAAKTPRCTAVAIAVPIEIFPAITYRLVAYEDRDGDDVEIDRRCDISWPQVGGIVGQLAEGDACRIIVFREDDPEHLVLRYDRDGFDL